MKKILAMVGGIGALYVIPVVAFAQSFTKIETFFKNIMNFINGTLVPLVFAIAFLAFLWGATKYFILGGADEGKREEGRQLMLYSIVAFVLMISIWGIVNLIGQGLFNTNDTIRIPQPPQNSSGSTGIQP